MTICGNCQQYVDPIAKFCAECGMPMSPFTPPPPIPVPRYGLPPSRHDPPPYTGASHSYGQPALQHSAPRGFAQSFGLHPAVALLTVVVNTMVFASGFISGGVGWLTSIPVGAFLGIITYMAQRKWYQDDNESAFIKALIVAFLTAIPTSLPGYLTIPSGVIGLFHRNKN